MATFKMGKVLLNSLFGKPATLMYPVVPREWTANTRGHIEIDVNECVLCGSCQRKCPANAITVDRNARTWTIQRMQCIQCNSCAENCPKKCLVMKPEYTTPDTFKHVDAFDIPAPAPKAAAPAAAASGAAEGGLKNDLDQCVFCGLCAKNCPAGAITVNRAEKKWEVDKSACVQCGLCVDNCPKKCLSL